MAASTKFATYAHRRRLGRDLAARVTAAASAIREGSRLMVVPIEMSSVVLLGDRYFSPLVEHLTHNSSVFFALALVQPISECDTSAARGSPRGRQFACAASDFGGSEGCGAQSTACACHYLAEAVTHHRGAYVACNALATEATARFAGEMPSMGLVAQTRRAALAVSNLSALVGKLDLLVRLGAS